MLNYVDMCLRHKVLTLNFELNIDKWNDFDPRIKKIVSKEWKMVKYMNEDGTKLNQEVETVPDDAGGVYLFLLKPEIIPGVHLYIMYIGRARRMKKFSLRQRCKAYYKDTRPEITMMRELWGAQLYFRYLVLENDELIAEVEEELLRVIIPPCNTRIPKYNEMPAQAAF
ncbi:MAG: hypothetical protein HFI13_07550 [Lachnospiraceae bacterium]|nr:hypothetical protein [Lachnospiraceae bacterium]